MKRKFGGWLAILCLLAICVACSSSSKSSEAELAIQQFYDHLAAEEYSAVLAMYNADVRNALQVSGGQVDQGFVEWAKEETKNSRVDRIEIVEESVETDTAEVKYRVVYNDGSSAERGVALIREEGQWRLGYIDNI